MDTKQKYVRLQYDQVIIFPCQIEHWSFKAFNPISAGFCYIDADKKTVECFGDSVSLDIKSNPEEDAIAATKQVFGWDAALKIMKKIG